MELRCCQGCHLPLFDAYTDESINLHTILCGILYIEGCWQYLGSRERLEGVPGQSVTVFFCV